MKDERIIVDVTKTLDLTGWIEDIVDDIIDDIDESLNDIYAEEGHNIKDEETKKVEKIYVAKIIEALTENYLKE